MRTYICGLESSTCRERTSSYWPYDENSTDSTPFNIQVAQIQWLWSNGLIMDTWTNLRFHRQFGKLHDGMSTEGRMLNESGRPGKIPVLMTLSHSNHTPFLLLLQFFGTNHIRVDCACHGLTGAARTDIIGGTAWNHRYEFFLEEILNGYNIHTYHPWHFWPSHMSLPLINIYNIDKTWIRVDVLKICRGLKDFFQATI